MSRAEFVRTELRLTADDDRVEALSAAIEDLVRTVRGDRRLEAILGADSETDVRERGDGIESETLERFVEERVVEPLLAALGFEDPSKRPEEFGAEPATDADYSVRVGGERVPIATEPPTGALDRRGVDRVEGWLEDRRLDARYGVATDGLRWILLRYDAASYDLDTLADVSLREDLAREIESRGGRSNPPAGLTGDSEVDSGGAPVRLARCFERDNLGTIVDRADEVLAARRREITEEFYQEYVRLVFGIVDEETGETTDRSLVHGGVEVPERVERSFENPRRLFSVSLVNRLIFVEFLEEAGLVEESLLTSMRADYAERRPSDDFYSAYLHPLFYRDSDREIERQTGRVAACLEGTPSPTDGLFRPALGHDVDESEYTPDELVRLEREFAVSDDLLFDVIEFLERYRFTTGGCAEILEDRSVPSLDPSVLGNVFEKTINYLAGEAGRQKDLGAFYTPDEITRFVAEETVRPVALEKLQTALRDRGVRDADAESCETVEGLVADLPSEIDVTEALQGTLDSLAVCDPACGSGHFLTAVLEEVVTIRKLVARAGRDAALSGREAAALTERTVRRNVFGVDVVAPAVEVARLRLWLAAIAGLDSGTVGGPDGEAGALSNAAPNVRVGNSLVGFPNLEFRSAVGGTLAEALRGDEHSDRRGAIESADDALAELVSDVTFEDACPIDGVDDVPAAVAELADAARDADVSAIGFYVEGDAPLTDAPPAYSDERLEDLGFTAHKWKARRRVSGRMTPPESAALIEAASSHPGGGVEAVYVERTISSDDLEDVSRFHWPVEFPRAIREDGDSTTFGFDVLVGNPPFGADVDDPEAALLDHEALFSCRGANNSAEHFLERAVQLTRPGGRLGFVLPKTLAYYTSWSEIRSTLLAESPPVTLLDNGLAFDGVDYEQVTLVAAPGGDLDGDHEVDTYVAEDLRDEAANDPVRAGSVPLGAMRSRETLVLRPMTERDRDIVAALESDTAPLRDLWSAEPWRGVYVPDSRKSDLADGSTPFLERVPSVQRYYLEAEGVWHVDVDDLPDRRRSSALQTMTPRLLFKVLRGSRLYVYPDGTGRFASTEKLVNVPIQTDGTSHSLRSLAAVLNSPVVSYYLQTLRFSETTETARVMDAHYIRDVPIPIVAARRAERLDAVVEHLLFAAQFADDGYGGGRARDHVDLLERVTDALVADLYFGLGADDLWDAVGACRSIAFDEWADARFAAGDYPLEEARSRWAAVDDAVAALTDAGAGAIVEAVESHELIERATDVLDG